MHAPTIESCRAAAIAFRDTLVAGGAACGEITHSINRHGEPSSYFAALGRTFRISDHDANTFYRPGEHHVLYHAATPELAARLLREWRRARKLHAWERRREDEKTMRREEAHFARFAAAEKPHQRFAIVQEAYPKGFVVRHGQREDWKRIQGRWTALLEKRREVA